MPFFFFGWEARSVSELLRMVQGWSGELERMIVYWEGGVRIGEVSGQFMG